MTNLKPCPFCASNDVEADIDYEYCTEDHKEYCVSCNNCGASSAFCEDEQKAIEAWNNRVK